MGWVSMGAVKKHLKFMSIRILVFFLLKGIRTKQGVNKKLSL